jgi:hypothetical protein
MEAQAAEVECDGHRPPLQDKGGGRPLGGGGGEDRAPEGTAHGGTHPSSCRWVIGSLELVWKNYLIRLDWARLAPDGRSAILPLFLFFLTFIWFHSPSLTFIDLHW